MSDLQIKASCYSRLDTRWVRPRVGMLKCNLHASWLNASSMVGGAWLLRDSFGDVMFHALDAFVSSSSRLEANFQVME